MNFIKRHWLRFAVMCIFAFAIVRFVGEGHSFTLTMINEVTNLVYIMLSILLAIAYLVLRGLDKREERQNRAEQREYEEKQRRLDRELELQRWEKMFKQFDERQARSDERLEALIRELRRPG